MMNSRETKFSLYLTSQLMYGITKIYSYQVSSCYSKCVCFIASEFIAHDVYMSCRSSDDVFKMWQDFNLEKRQEQEFDVIRAMDTFPSIDLPTLREALFSTHLNENLHLLPDEELADRLQMIVRGL